MTDETPSASDPSPGHEPHAETGGLPPIEDPYLTASRPAPAPPRLSGLSLASLFAVVLGPVGSLAAISLGLRARERIRTPNANLRGEGVALAGIVLGGATSLGWLGLFVVWMLARSASLSGGPMPSEADDGRLQPFVQAPPVSGHVPDETRDVATGALTVVDLGRSEPNLEAALMKQVDAARERGETVVLMTTRGDCDPCRGVERSLPDPRMQEALSKTRLVRVDIDTFAGELATMGMFVDRYPGFFLLGVDARPKDGIDGGEWGDDIPPNIAPVLGPFVRGKLTQRRDPWAAPPRTGVTL